MLTDKPSLCILGSDAALYCLLELINCRALGPFQAWEARDAQQDAVSRDWLRILRKKKNQKFRFMFLKSRDSRMGMPSDVTRNVSLCLSQCFLSLTHFVYLWRFGFPSLDLS